MKINRELIGNLMILLSERCKPLYHTKLLKLLYLTDEESARRTGAPLTWLSYNVWQFGPVAEDIYFSKIEGCNKFGDFVRFDALSDEKYIIRPVAVFNDSDFGDGDLQIVEDVIGQYGHLNTKQLVSITHTKGSLWERAKRAGRVQFSAQNRTSPVTLSFSDLLGDDELKRSIYYHTLENMQIQSAVYDL
jgi:uncharacterized phage-associated protein